jgi:hypothetical protein
MVFRKKTGFKRYRKSYIPRTMGGLKKVIASTMVRKAEPKYFDVAGTTWGQISNVWNEYNMTAIAQGTDINNRIGDRIEVLGVELNLIMQNSYGLVSSADVYNVVRNCLYECEIGNSLTFGGLKSQGLTINKPLRFDTCATLDAKFMDKYIILIPQQAWNNGATVQMGTDLKHVKAYIKFRKPKVIHYSGSSNLSGNKGLFLSFLSDSNVSPNPTLVDGWATTHFRDI